MAVTMPRPVLLGLVIAIGGAVAVAMAGFWRDASPYEEAMIEAAAGIGLALYSYIRGARERRWRRREESWARAEATITRADVIETSVWGGGSSTYYKPQVSYRFSVDGTEHEGHRIQMDAGASTDRAQVRSWIAGYSEGGTVLAYYDPKDPSSSVLELDDDGGILLVWAWLCLTIFGTAAAAFALYGWLRH
jgi:hypothetical protein